MNPWLTVLVIGGIYLYLKGHISGTAVCMGLAVLTKEVTILFVVAIGLYLIFRKFRSGFLFGAIAVVPYILWKVILFSWFQDWGFSAGGAMATSFEWIPYAGWWKLAGVSLPGFLTMSILILPLVIIPSFLALYTSIRQLIRRQFNEFTLILFFSAVLVPFLPSSNILDPLGVSRALIGLVIAWILYGARNQSKRILSYCLLFALTGIFIWRDAFLPVGTYSKNA